MNQLFVIFTVNMIGMLGVGFLVYVLSNVFPKKEDFFKVAYILIIALDLIFFTKLLFVVLTGQHNE